jgi:hypothetical protein
VRVAVTLARMRKTLIPLVLVFVALMACTKSKKPSGGECTAKADCQEGLECFIIGIKFACLTKEQGEAACKLSPECKSSGKKCGVTLNATHADKPEYMMGGCE